MKIAVVGTRGIPAKYGGFETMAEAISTGLVKKGHDVTVYCRTGNNLQDFKKYAGVRLVNTRFISNKYFGTFSHTFFSLIHSLGRNFDIYLVFNVGVVPLCLIPKLLGKKVVLMVDGFEWNRKKWNNFAKMYFIICARLSSFLSDKIVTDSREVKKYYLAKLKTRTVYITNGAEIRLNPDRKILDKFNVTPGNYFFTASRLVPENNIELLIKAFLKLETDKKFLIAGEHSFSSGYYRKLINRKNDGVVFLGPVYSRKELDALHGFCFAYLHGNDSGGTSLGLLKAMGYGNCVFTIDTPSNREVAGDSAVYYDNLDDDLYVKMKKLLLNRKKWKVLKLSAANRIRKKYLWNKIIEDYEKLLLAESGY